MKIFEKPIKIQLKHRHPRTVNVCHECDRHIVPCEREVVYAESSFGREIKPSCVMIIRPLHETISIEEECIGLVPTHCHHYLECIGLLERK